ncbi:EXPERA domain-containing protein [Aspergillus lucknowensis]|uniref:Efficient mitochondria targeting-associated protein 19 n=1 Tax=Aspergillus lucknowensis TaxID=176173 RepID=A0ABR4LV24_9EURO
MALWSRKRDLIYFGFFAIHIPIILLVDAVPILPSPFDNTISRELRNYYITTFRDKFFEGPAPGWFTSFMYMELYYHLPLSVWALGALLRDDPLVPIHLLVFGFQSFLTAWTCLVEVWDWEDRSLAEKRNLTSLYGPYVALGGFMALDMFWRLRKKLLSKSKQE